MDTGAEDQNEPNPAGLMLYSHFQQAVVPGWLDKHLRWRHRATHALDHMVLLSPHPDRVRSLPHAKLPDRNDFIHYAHDPTQHMRLWRTAVSASEQLAEEFGAWVERPDGRRLLFSARCGTRWRVARAACCTPPPTQERPAPVWLGFEDIGRSPRHKSGIAVRFPRMLRWREDKPVEEADSLQTLAALLPGQAV